MNSTPKTVCFDLRSLQMGHESRGIGMHVRSILENLPNNPSVSYVFYAFDLNDPIKKLNIQLNINYTLVKTKAVKKSIDRPQDFVHLSKIIWHRFTPLKNSGIDVFIQFDFMLGLPKFEGVKNVIFAYDLIPLLFPNDYLPTPLYAFSHASGRVLPFKKALRAAYYRARYHLHYKNYILADTIISISDHTSRSLVTMLGIDQAKVITIPLAPVFNTGIASRPNNFSEAQKPFLFYIGATDKRKRVQDLVAAYNILRGRGHDLTLVLAGKEFDIVEKIPNLDIRHAILNSSYRDGIVNLGYVNDSEKLWLYQNALVFVFPTLHEGFGLPIVEAMQSGCPVVSYDNSSIPEVSGDAALLVPSGDTQGLVARLNYILKNPHKRKELQYKGNEQASKYTWPNYIKSFLAAIL